MGKSRLSRVGVSGARPLGCGSGGGMSELDLVDAAVGGDADAFGLLVGRYQSELRLHCYRMLGSVVDAEDAVQDAFARAWRSRGSFEHRDRWSYRSWLYRIASNCCLDALRGRERRVLPYSVVAAASGVVAPPRPDSRAWMEPIPDRLLLSGSNHDPTGEDLIVARETVELVFLAAIQYLTPRQRCVLIARDVLAWPASDAATLLEISVAAVNSALQRARSRLREHLPADRLTWSRSATTRAEERALVGTYMRAIESRDQALMRTLLHRDARASFPPMPLWYEGRESFLRGTKRWAAPGEYRCVSTGANLQPAVAIYLRPPGELQFRPLALEALTIHNARIVDIVDFGSPDFFARFDLPRAL